MSHQINIMAFDVAYSNALVQLATAEKVSKETLKGLSRDVLIAWHQTGHIQYANKLLAILSPMNKKVCIVFFKRFSGYSFDEVTGAFTKKSKKRYEQAHAECMEALNDPHFNVWTWADRNVTVEAKPFDVEAVTKYFTGVMKKAQGAGLTQADVLRAVFKAGIEPSALVVAFNEMAFKDAEGDVVELPIEAFVPAAKPLESAPL